MERDPFFCMLMKLLLSPAIDASGRGWKISGFALIVIAIVLITALVRAPAAFVGGSALAGTVWKGLKYAQKKISAPSKPAG